MSKVRVEVWGQTIMVDVEQRSKSVWVASLDYLGKSYSGKGRSPAAAASAAKEAARYATG